VCHSVIYVPSFHGPYSNTIVKPLIARENRMSWCVCLLKSNDEVGLRQTVVSVPRRRLLLQFVVLPWSSVYQLFSNFNVSITWYATMALYGGGVIQQEPFPLFIAWMLSSICFHDGLLWQGKDWPNWLFIRKQYSFLIICPLFCTKQHDDDGRLAN